MAWLGLGLVPVFGSAIREELSNELPYFFNKNRVFNLFRWRDRHDGEEAK